MGERAKNSKLPSLVRTAINRRAHALALVEEARLRQVLTEQARKALGTGAPAGEVLALLGAPDTCASA